MCSRGFSSKLSPLIPQIPPVFIPLRTFVVRAGRRDGAHDRQHIRAQHRRGARERGASERANEHGAVCDESGRARARGGGEL